MALLRFPPYKSHALKLIAAYSYEVTNPMLAAFDNIEAEAEEASQEYYDQKMDAPAPDDCGPDAADIASAADDYGIDRYNDLTFVTYQVTGLAIAGFVPFVGTNI
jgi:hypothetical protein